MHRARRRLVAFLHVPRRMIPALRPIGTNRFHEFTPGDVIDGRYRIVRRLAEGGMGTVFLAEHVLIHRRFAIKQLHAELAADRGMLGRFLNEAAAAGMLSHPHIIESTDMGFTRDRVPYIVFEYLEGCLLTEEIRRIGALPARRALVIARQIASALEAAHHARIAHLDLKSDNVFLTHKGGTLDHAKLIDFGIARFMDVEIEKPQLAVLMGTPEFMAPEQVTSPDTVDGRADIYALGVLLYEMLTGRCPFEGEDPRAVLHRAIHEPPPPLGRSVPPGVEQLMFEGLLAKSRDRRLQTMSEVIGLLDAQIVAMWSQVPRALETFEDSAAELAGMLARPIWSVESLIDDAPGRLEGSFEIPCEADDRAAAGPAPGAC